MPPTVVPVTLDRWPDLVALFATSEVMRGCWCMWPRRLFGQHQLDQGNKALLQAIVESGTVPGMLAYVDGAPAGWCSVGPRPDYPRSFDEHAEQDIWLIACLFIAASHRGQGVASALISAAVRYAAEHGARSIEALPRGWRPDDDPSTMDAVRQIFRRAGFADQAGVEAPARLRRDLLQGATSPPHRDRGDVR